ncbi:hypothetical protein PR048_005043 [Dryococelus australis]|uniref:Uncharacterized protein n=1 Tax=Dryococelus australis TaxID=614101 RepID=A0ABQ9I955_9NEOP|nr:hypothetical protein PR048_005043 [Dryococelus australis]
MVVKRTYPKKKPLANSSVCHVSHIQKFVSTLLGIEFDSPWWEASCLATRYATTGLKETQQRVIFYNTTDYARFKRVSQPRDAIGRNTSDAAANDEFLSCFHNNNRLLSPAAGDTDRAAICCPTRKCISTALNNVVLRVRQVWSSTGMKGRGKRDIPEKTCPPAAKNPPTCENPKGRGGVVVRLLASSQGEPGSIPDRVTPEVSYVGTVPGDAAGRRFIWGISHFLHRCIPTLFHTHPASTSSALKISMLRAAKISSATHTIYLSWGATSVVPSLGVPCDLSNVEGSSPK